MSAEAPTYSRPTVVWAEGNAKAGIAVCDVCGGAVLVDPRESFSALERHTEWHRYLRGVLDGP